MRGKLRPGGRIRLAEQSGLVLLRRMKLLKIYHLDFKAPLTTSFPSQSTITRTRSYGRCCSTMARVLKRKSCTSARR